MNIEINGRSYQVTTQTAKNGQLQYILTGKRGAIYATCRNVNHPHMMFLVDQRGFGVVGKQAIWLTDKNGSLELARK